ncbi:Transcriptional regulator, xre family [Leuconostoc gelidum subsp. gasicomitatum]|uniref:Transcriptional regulator, xre family n=1 Tax=Leuconostoc gasicomitatum TaxID=115778 RepID=A0ABM9V0F1_9LACO|nr:helix-turn-helix transcriptional regulator [Leuconostoc gasicomitatum]CUW05329.1 Transcriptional regulator, xre family [Leuconostoc gasicomitatum]CUW10551.1 Transcriptional regulator, xre family [Leuconostoc gasicomitatum]
MKNLSDYKKISNADLSQIVAGRAQDIAPNLVKLRKLSGYTRHDIAKKLSISTSSVAKYEEGLRVPDIDTIIDICHIFKTDIHNIID